MRALWVIWLGASVSVGRAATLGTYNIAFQNSVQYAPPQPAGINGLALAQTQIPVSYAPRSSAAVYRQPFLNRNGVVSRNPDAVWNDPVESVPLYPTPVPGAQFLVYGDPNYGGYQGTFGGLSAYGYKAKRASSKKA